MEKLMKKEEYKCPKLAVDALVLRNDEILLIKRKNPPYGWALPGGFVDYGESVEDAVKRELKEETCLDTFYLKQFKVFSDPKRDPRMHIVSVVFQVWTDGIPKAADDAKKVKFFNLNELPDLAFDHQKIINDFCKGDEDEVLFL